LPTGVCVASDRPVARARPGKLRGDVAQILRTIAAESAPDPNNDRSMPRTKRELSLEVKTAGNHLSDLRLLCVGATVALSGFGHERSR
jgi:hypothetical protein